MTFFSTLNKRTLLICFVLSFATAGVGGALTDLGPWYANLKQPDWKPPDAAFGPIWTVIFSLCALSACLAWQNANTTALRVRVAVLFAVNATLNVWWSWLYFTRQRPDWALLELFVLWFSVLALVLGLWRLSRLASAMIVPYLVWVTIAGFLNVATIELNGPFAKKATTEVAVR